jgi:ABC-type Fe3+/spermidine/putrescine transport system ATPase subunit
MVFQNYALFPHMTVADNIAYPLTVRKLDRNEIDTKVKRALDMVQMGAHGPSATRAAVGRPAAARGPGPRAGVRPRSWC